MKISNSRYSDKVYINNYNALKARLQEYLQGYRNVFTHNPWGEYGHIEHVQVYRVIKSLQKELQFNLWFSNYVSNMSARLMVNELAELGPETVTLPTDRSLAEDIASIYKLNKCWTWYDDYEWCDNETFIQSADDLYSRRKYGALLPINLINIEKLPKHKSTLGSSASKVRGSLKKLFINIRGSI